MPCAPPESEATRSTLWVLGTELRSQTRATCALPAEPALQACVCAPHSLRTCVCTGNLCHITSRQCAVGRVMQAVLKRAGRTAFARLEGQAQVKPPPHPLLPLTAALGLTLKTCVTVVRDERMPTNFPIASGPSLPTSQEVLFLLRLSWQKELFHRDHRLSCAG